MADVQQGLSVLCSGFFFKSNNILLDTNCCGGKVPYRVVSPFEKDLFYFEREKVLSLAIVLHADII